MEKELIELQAVLYLPSCKQEYYKRVGGKVTSKISKKVWFELWDKSWNPAENIEVLGPITKEKY